MITEGSRPKGFCYIEFATRADLAEALKLNNEVWWEILKNYINFSLKLCCFFPQRLSGRPVKIDLADQERNKKPYEHQTGGRQRYMAGEGQSESQNDWRTAGGYRPPPPSMARERGPPQDVHYGAGRPPIPPTTASYAPYSRCNY